MVKWLISSPKTIADIITIGGLIVSLLSAADFVAISNQPQLNQSGDVFISAFKIGLLTMLIGIAYGFFMVKSKPNTLLVGILIGLIVSLAFTVSPVSAIQVKSGWDNALYWNNTLPNHSYVYQGANISQGYTYDLSGIYGFSGNLAHWTYETDEGMTMPDNIYTINKPYNVVIDPAIFPIGRWYQWDGAYCFDGKSCTASSFGHGNPYVFYVASQPPKINETPKSFIALVSSNITIEQNGTMVDIPVTYTQVQTYYGTEIPTITARPTENKKFTDQNGYPIVGEVPAASIVTQKAPSSVAIVVIALVIFVLMVRRRE